MPPKARFTKEEIIFAALSVVRREGMASLTARALAAELGSSARPIFTVFQSMEEVQHEVREAAKAEYNDYVKRGLTDEPAFKGVGMQYIKFAQEEPKLFQLLFMSELKEEVNLSEVLPVLDENYDTIVKTIRELYRVEEADAWSLYRHLWIYTHGIAALCAAKVCNFSEKEISEMLTEVFVSILQRVKAGR